MLRDFRVRDMDTTTQLVFDNMVQYDDLYKLNDAILKISGIKKLSEKSTFEGEIFRFSYQEIRFTTFFEEFGDEVVISIPKPQDPRSLIELISKEHAKN